MQHGPSSGNARIRISGVHKRTLAGILRDMLGWDDLRVFLAVHRARSHAGAARTLRVAATTVGRRMGAVERRVGARLFTRTPDGLVPTGAGLLLLAHAERVDAEVLEAERELSGADARPTGTVRITAGDGFTTYVLCPALPLFLGTHPGLSVELRASVRVLDLPRGEADAALRLFRPRERSLVARRVGQERYGLYAAPGYLEARGMPRTAHELSGHDLVLYERDFDRLPAQAWLRQTATGARIAVRGSTTTTLHAACAAGAGIALLTSAYVRGDHRFVPVLPRLAPPPSELWTVTHQDLRGVARVVAALRWLEELVRSSERGS
jgi:DNA-binding transcriptional LysR family regulator